VVDGVGGKFAYDAEDGVCGCFVEASARHVEVNLHARADDDGGERLAHCVCEVPFGKGVLSQIPQAAAQLGAAGKEHP